LEYEKKRLEDQKEKQDQLKQELKKKEK